MNIIDGIKDFLRLRGVQLLARFVLKGVMFLAGILEVKFEGDMANQIAIGLATLLVGGILILLDRWQHREQTLDVVARTADMMVAKVVSQVPVSLPRVLTPPAAQAVMNAAAAVKAETQVLGKLPEKA